MKRKLSDQEKNELLTSKAMKPAARLNWLAAALEFTREIERSRAASRKKRK